jgi:hypothetical protein
VFTDYCAGDFFVIAHEGDAFAVSPLGVELGSVTSFGEDEAGEIYAASDRDGAIYQIVKD